jgi:phage-related protein
VRAGRIRLSSGRSHGRCISFWALPGSGAAPTIHFIAPDHIWTIDRHNTGVIVPDDGRQWHVEAYRTPAGNSLMRAFMTALNARNRADAAALIMLLEERGNELRSPHSKQVEGDLYELRKHQVRIFYTFRPGHRIILLDGIVKKQDRIPSDVLKRLRLLLAELVVRERLGRS